MPNSFDELRERLIRSGVAPRHVRRYLTELTEHLADLRAEEERAGRNGADAESAALKRLGDIDDLSKAMTEQRHFQSWCARAQWALFGLAPLLLLAGAYFVACMILYSGWRIFLPEANTPFVEIGGFAVIYFGVGKLIYFGAPILIGWGIGLIAARENFRAFWPTVGFVLVALTGATAHVHSSHPVVPGGAGIITMDFTLGPSAQALFHALVILSLTALPYFIWRLQKPHSFSA